MGGQSGAPRTPHYVISSWKCKQSGRQLWKPDWRKPPRRAKGLTDSRQMISPLPLAREHAQNALQSGGLRGSVGEGEGFAAGLLEEFAVAERVGDVETKGAGLAGAEEFAGAAKLEIGFGDFKAVGGAHHGFEAGAGFVGHAHRADKDAVGFLRAAADASAKLMKLREAEALGVLDDHDRGVGDIDADFDDGGGDKDLHFIFAELLHDVVFFVA